MCILLFSLNSTWLSLTVIIFTNLPKNTYPSLSKTLSRMLINSYYIILLQVPKIPLPMDHLPMAIGHINCKVAATVGEELSLREWVPNLIQKKPICSQKMRRFKLEQSPLHPTNSQSQKTWYLFESIHEHERRDMGSTINKNLGS